MAKSKPFDENNPEFVEAILNDVDEQLRSINLNNVDRNNEPDSDEEIEEFNNSRDADVVPFGGFDNMLNTLMNFEEQLLCPEVQQEAGEENYQLL